MGVSERTVSDIMTDMVATIGDDHTWEDAARRMSAKNIHHLIIVDPARKPVGILSSFDFLAFALDREEMLREKPLSESHAKRKIISVSPSDSLAHAANLMHTHHVECLPVENPAGHVVGIVTPHDLMMAIFPG